MMNRILTWVAACLWSLPLSAQETRDSATLEPVEVRATRAGRTAPFTKTNLSAGDIEKGNLGQDLPFLLNGTPSAVTSSDAGNGIGYTGLRIRGIDLTRINVTLNGIPYNDAESQSVYFVDLPDFASSLSSVQVQRGVGTSSNGPGAFGATINLSTNEVHRHPYAQLLNTIGAFGTRRHTVKAGTGLIDGKFTVDARLSKISSEGFIDRGTSDLKAFYLSGAWMNARTSIRLNVFSGKEKTFQSWNGIPEHKLFYNHDSLLAHYYNNLGSLYFTREDSTNLFTADGRKYNLYLYPNQTDNYTQDHYQFFVNHQLGTGLQLSTALFLTQGEGYYEELKYNQRYSAYGLPNATVGSTTFTRTDLVRQLWLKNDLYGVTASLQWKKARFDLTAGGSMSRFNGKHFGTITWATQGIGKDHEWYRYPSSKDDGNIYAKLGYRATQRLYVLGDLQYRFATHRISGTRKFPGLEVDRSFRFFNPKLGVFYDGDFLDAYISYAVAKKEPNRTDFETAAAETPRHEQLHDWELGISHNGSGKSFGATIYYMNYTDQLVLTGKINDVGDAIRINVPLSYRLGLEVWGGIQLSRWLRLEGNAAISSNRLQAFTDYVAMYDADFEFTGYDTLRFSRVPIAFSPALVTYASVQAEPLKGLALSLNTKSVSSQYLDNTGSGAKMIRGYITQDLQARYVFVPVKGMDVELVFQVNNLWNRTYESNGYTYSYYYDSSLVKENFYYPAAGRNWMAGVNIKL